MAYSRNLFPVPLVPFQREGSQTFLASTANTDPNPGGSQIAWKAPPTSCFLIMVGEEKGHRSRGLDLRFFSDGTSAITIDEIGVGTICMDKGGNPLDLASWNPLFQNVALTFGTMEVEDPLKTEMDLDGETLSLAHTVSIGTKTALWTAFHDECGIDVVQYAPGSNGEARLTIPYLADESFLYVYAGNGGIGTGTGLGILARHFGGKK